MSKMGQEFDKTLDENKYDMYYLLITVDSMLSYVGDSNLRVIKDEIKKVLDKINGLDNK